MKKHICVWIALICSVAWAEAQLVTVVKRSAIENSTPAFYPVFSQDGAGLLYTSENYKGLYLYDLKSKTSQKLTDADGAGYNDYRMAKADARMGSPVKKTISAYTEKLQLIVERNGVRKVLEPLPKGSRYLWGSLSPDQSRILFTATGKGSYICDLNGRILSGIGYLNAPVWYGNTMVVGMVDKDNGESITASSITVVSVDGKQRQALTPIAEIAMYPAADIESGKIAYNTLEGEIRVLELKK